MDKTMAKILYKEAIINTECTMNTSVEALAVCRRTIELIGVPELLEEYDTKFSTAIDHYSKIIGKMDLFELTQFLTSKISK